MLFNSSAISNQSFSSNIKKLKQGIDVFSTKLHDTLAYTAGKNKMIWFRPSVGETCPCTSVQHGATETVSTYLNAFVCSAVIGRVCQCKISGKYGCSVTIDLEIESWHEVHARSTLNLLSFNLTLTRHYLYITITIAVHRSSCRHLCITVTIAVHRSVCHHLCITVTIAVHRSSCRYLCITVTIAVHRSICHHLCITVTIVVHGSHSNSCKN